MVTAYYDLQVSPPTYDFHSFLLASGAKTVKVIPGPQEGFRKDNLPPDTKRRNMMLNNVVLASQCLLDCKIEMGTRDEELQGPVFPEGYRLDRPRAYYGTRVLMEALQKTPRPSFRYGEPNVLEKPYVTMTLRESCYWPQRNADLQTFDLAAKILLKEINVYLIRDVDARTAMSAPDVPGADKDIRIRMSAYENAQMNFFTINGPAVLAYGTTHVPYTAFYELDIPGVPVMSRKFYEKSGLPEGSQIPGCGERQTIVWQKPTVAGIIDAI